MKLSKEQKEFLTNRKAELEKKQSDKWLAVWLFLNVIIAPFLFPELFFLIVLLWIGWFIEVIIFYVNRSHRDKEIKEIEFKLLSSKNETKN